MTTTSTTTKRRPIDEKMHPALKKYLKAKRGINGLGLFTETDITKGEYIIEYWGPILTADEANQKGGLYLFEISSRRTIDGTHRANIARYLNHSCRPNCEVDIKKGRVLIFAKRAIKAGEELCYDYGREYWNEYIKPKGCRCSKCAEKQIKAS